MRDLTPEEREVVEKLGECAVAFDHLPRLHPSHPEEFAFAIHAAQRIVMSRPAGESLRAQQP